jgi:signal transduction histidine kinase
MKYVFHFKSIYARFAVIFIGIWWVMNTLAFGVVMRIMSGSTLINKTEFLRNHAGELIEIRRITGLVFLGSVLVGTAVILLAVRNIVRPIRKLSKAAGSVAEGNFAIRVEPAGHDEIGQLTTDFNSMVKSLQGIEVLRREFVANVSHEFRTPITAINGYAMLIEAGDLPEHQRREYAKIIVDESQRLSALSANLLRLSEFDGNLVREQACRYPLDEQIRKSVLLLQLQWEQKAIELDVDLEPVEIVAAEHLLQEVWLNLIGNAIKFSPDGGIIRIRLVRSNDRAILSITDQGPGISDDDKPHIYERFYVGDKARTKNNNGIGLAIVKKIIDMTGGRITCQSDLGNGTTFQVDWPINPNNPEVHHVQ